MRNLYGEIYNYVNKLCEQLNAFCEVCPKVYVTFSQRDKALSGLCKTTYRVSQMYLEIIIPYNYNSFGKKRQTEVAATLIHEYGHYITELQFTGKERVKFAQAYMYNQLVRRCNEQSNWTFSKQLAQQLGMWNKYFYNTCKETYYSSNLKYN